MRRSSATGFAAIPLSILLAGSLALTPSGSTDAATLTVSYRSLERMIVNRILTEGGRYYLEGSAEETCRYAFVQEPRVEAVSDRLRITLLFAGRAGAQVAGRCVGPGDNFDLEITGRPVFEGGDFLLADLSIDAPDTAYFKIVAPLIRTSLAERLRAPVMPHLDELSAWVQASGNGMLEIRTLTVDSIEVTAESLGAVFDFGFAIGTEPMGGAGR